MKRRIFFLLERLKITPTERKAVAGLAALLLTFSILNATLSAPVPFGDEDYAELDAQFRQQVNRLRAQEEQLMQRYGSAEKVPLMAAADTIPADTARIEPLETDEAAAAGARININMAGREALETLPGIGPVYARRIIDYRRERGNFQHIDELINIRGIGEKRLDKLKPFVKLKDSD